jgi:beta-lactam-binding protein with PASTA domain
VYVTVNSSSPPPVILPSLVGTYDYGQYTRKLQRLGIKYRLIEKRFDAKLEENTILFVYFNGKEVSDEELRQGFKIPKGSTVDFIVSERKSNLVSIPDLRCKTYNQAVFVLNSMGLDIGQILGDVADYNYAYVYKQDPSPTEALTASLGTRVNLYLSDTLPDDCATTEGAADSLSNNY